MPSRRGQDDAWNRFLPPLACARDPIRPSASRPCPTRGRAAGRRRRRRAPVKATVPALPAPTEVADPKEERSHPHQPRDGAAAVSRGTGSGRLPPSGNHAGRTRRTVLSPLSERRSRACATGKSARGLPPMEKGQRGRRPGAGGRDDRGTGRPTRLPRQVRCTGWGDEVEGLDRGSRDERCLTHAFDR
jgi:hypothetical protein